MKAKMIALFVLIPFVSQGQVLKWIPFKWTSDTISGRPFEKVAMMVPVSFQYLPYKFNMQLDLGAVNTVLYGNTWEAFAESHPELKEKLDSTLTFLIQGKKNYKLRDIELSLGEVSFGKRNIGYFKEFGDSITIDSIGPGTEVRIGTIAPDLFQEGILIIDYPNNRICYTSSLPKEYSKASFLPFKLEKGRIKLPFVINNKKVDLLFDTGSSLFPLITTMNTAKQVSSGAVVDSFMVASWGRHYMIYGEQTVVPLKFAKRPLASTIAYYEKEDTMSKFFEKERIWGITGNALFLDQIVIIDYVHRRFGVR